MGSWGTGSFANDDVNDWITDLQYETDLTPVRDALEEAVNDVADYLDAPTAAIAIAAAEIVAAIKGHPSKQLPEEVTDWIRGIRATVDNPLLAVAVKAVEAVNADQDHSEMRELWEHAGEEDRLAWQANLVDLKGRLA